MNQEPNQEFLQSLATDQRKPIGIFEVPLFTLSLFCNAPLLDIGLENRHLYKSDVMVIQKNFLSAKSLFQKEFHQARSTVTKV